MAHQRKPRRCLSLVEKKTVLDDLAAGKPVVDVAGKLGISKSQVDTIRKNADSLKRTISKGDIPGSSKVSTNISRYPSIDKAVFQWFRSIRAFKGSRKPLPVSRSMLKARAALEAKRLRVVNFCASDGWLFRWRWRFNVTVSARLHGEAADVDLVAAECEMHKLRTELAQYSISNIFNMDETGLFYRAIPNRSYLCEGDACQTGRGSKAIKAKERLTVILCVNATGSCKMTQVVIGSAKQPRCFKKTPSCLPYYFQPNAWNDTANYNKWWNEVFLPSIRKHTHDPVAFLIDGFSGHDKNCVDPLGQVRVFRFPPNITSVFQPLDQGIIAALKTGYKSRLLLKVVETAESYAGLQVMARQLPNGCAGLQYGSPAHVGDAVMILKEEWDSITPSTIAACWAHSRCLPLLSTSELGADAQDYTRKVELETVREMCSMLSNVSLTNPSVVDMLADVGLNVVIAAAHKVHDKASRILLEWLCLEEESMIDVEDEGEQSENSEVVEESADPVQLLSEVLPLAERLHAIGAKLNDACLMDLARQVCTRVKHVTSATQ